MAEKTRRALGRDEDRAEQADRGGGEERERRREREPVDLRRRDRGGDDHGVAAEDDEPAGRREQVLADRRGPDREREQDRDERDDERELAEAEVERLLAHGLAAVAVEHGRDQPQRVHRGEHDRGRADGGVPPALREDAGEDRELAREVGGAGHGERQHPDDHHDRGERRAALREPAELGEAVGAGALDQHRGEQEHRRRDEAVADRVEDGARSRPRSSAAKMPSTIRLIWPIDEYAITPRTSGWRNASSEP